MEFTVVLQAIANGILLGGIYALVSLGANVVWGVMRVVNFAHGTIVIFCSYFAFYLFTYAQIDPLASLVLGLPLFFVVGLALETVFVRPVRRRATEAGFENTTLITFFGLSITMAGLMFYFFTTIPRTISVSYSPVASYNVFGIYLPPTRLIAFAIAVICIAAIFVFLMRTRTGKAIRATSQDSEAASLVGVDINRISMLALGIGTSMASVAGVVIGISYPFSSASDLSWALKAFIVVVLGGIGSIGGSLVAGIILGIAEVVTGNLVSMIYSDIVSLLIFVLVVLLRPKGLFGRK
jgi:branched-chain amino acid transport system permease protein